jgi:hypothetical protein
MNDKKKFTFSVVALGPVVSGSGLSEDEVVGAEDLSVGTGPDRVHGSGLEVDKDGARNVLAAGSFIVVDVDAFQLD